MDEEKERAEPREEAEGPAEGPMERRDEKAAREVTKRDAEDRRMKGERRDMWREMRVKGEEPERRVEG